MRIAPEGWPFILPSLGLAGLGLALAALGPESNTALRMASWVGVALFGVFAAFSAYFFRNPVRIRRDADGIVLAPADGKIVEIKPVEEPDFFHGPATRISIFLNVFNVHVQRAPITGRIEHRSFRPGGFAAAWKPSASAENEQATLGITSGVHRVMVRQIAGLVARRIVTDPEEGELVPQGSRIGLIRFGSRVDLFLPPEWEVTCSVGDGTKGGLTDMAKIPRDSIGGKG
jgi:phosphatidylserine decarboxylase